MQTTDIDQRAVCRCPGADELECRPRQTKIVEGLLKPSDNLTHCHSGDNHLDSRLSLPVIAIGFEDGSMLKLFVKVRMAASPTPNDLQCFHRYGALRIYC